MKKGFKIEHKLYGSFAMEGDNVVGLYGRYKTSQPYHIFCLICDNGPIDTGWSASLPEEVRSEVAKMNA